jgi:hypothetical protein
VQALILALVILGFIAFVYQGIALSSRQEPAAEQSSTVTLPPR